MDLEVTKTIKIPKWNYTIKMVLGEQSFQLNVVQVYSLFFGMWYDLEMGIKHHTRSLIFDYEVLGLICVPMKVQKVENLGSACNWCNPNTMSNWLILFSLKWLPLLLKSGFNKKLCSLDMMEKTNYDEKTKHLLGY